MQTIAIEPFCKDRAPEGLAQVLGPAIEHGVQIDLEGVSLVPTTFLQVLLAAKAEVEAAEKPWIVKNSSQEARASISLAGLDLEAFGIED